MSSTFARNRKHGQSILGPVERRFINWAVPRIPAPILSHHFTLATLVWSAGTVGAGWMARRNLAWLHVVPVMVFLQWLTDSLDGSLGKHRRQGLVKWGFFKDHLLDLLFHPHPHQAAASCPRRPGVGSGRVPSPSAEPRLPMRLWVVAVWLVCGVMFLFELFVGLIVAANSAVFAGEIERNGDIEVWRIDYGGSTGERGGIEEITVRPTHALWIFERLEATGGCCEGYLVPGPGS
ncbi:MAG: hypothetical protein OEY70_19605 [Acidimicrobiia bacterium]|nr:hypothetical protein [Acidimicrobiia bacterium]